MFALWLTTGCALVGPVDSPTLQPTVTKAVDLSAETAVSVVKFKACQGRSQTDCLNFVVEEQAVWDSVTTCVRYLIRNTDIDVAAVMQNGLQGWNDVAAYPGTNCQDARKIYYKN